MKSSYDSREKNNLCYEMLMNLHEILKQLGGKYELNEIEATVWLEGIKWSSITTTNAN